LQRIDLYIVGATREDPVSTKRIQAYLKEHGVDMYQYMNVYDFNDINGSLYVLTGCDKGPSYNLALFPMEDDLPGKRVSPSCAGTILPHAAFAPNLIQGVMLSILWCFYVALAEDLWAQYLYYQPKICPIAVC